MTVSFQLPDELEQLLRQDNNDLGAEAKEAFLVDLYRRGKLTHLGLSQALRVDRLQTEELLHKHNITEDLGVLEDYLADAKGLQDLRSRGR